MYGYGGDLPQRTPLLDLERTVAPGVSPLDLADVRQHLKIDFTDDDEQIQAYMDAVVESLDGYAGYLGRCLVEQTWVLNLDRFPRAGERSGLGHDWRELMLPLSPLIAVDSVVYTDPTGAQQTLDPTTYVVRTGNRAAIALRSGQCWPQTSCDPRSVQITFRAGYAAKGDNAEPDPADVPRPIVAALKLMVGDLYENREAVVVAESRVTQIVNPTADRLLGPYRASWL